jgi:hypothetical protein
MNATETVPYATALKAAASDRIIDYNFTAKRRYFSVVGLRSPMPRALKVIIDQYHPPPN